MFLGRSGGAGGTYDVTLAWGRPEVGVLLGATARGASALAPATLGQTLHWQGLALRAGTLAATRGVYVRTWQ